MYTDTTAKNLDDVRFTVHFGLLGDFLKVRTVIVLLSKLQNCNSYRLKITVHGKPVHTCL